MQNQSKTSQIDANTIKHESSQRDVRLGGDHKRPLAPPRSLATWPGSMTTSQLASVDLPTPLVRSSSALPEWRGFIWSPASFRSKTQIGIIFKELQWVGLSCSD